MWKASQFNLQYSTADWLLSPYLLMGLAQEARAGSDLLQSSCDISTFHITEKFISVILKLMISGEYS